MSASIDNESWSNLTYEEKLAIYDQGPEVVISIIDTLFMIVTEQAKEIKLLTARVQYLEGRLNKDSHNSSKPPSSDGLRKKPSPKSQRPKGDKRSGGQPGHPGSTLQMSKKPDRVINHTPGVCADCGTCLDNEPLDNYEARQVYDLPRVRLEAIEHRNVCQTCPHCGKANHGSFPEGVTHPVQYGERIKGLGVYFTNFQLLPLERTTAILSDIFGCSLSEAVLLSSQQICAHILAPINEAIKQALQMADLAHFDETGQRIAGKLHWLHVACTERWTYYATHAKRGRAAMEEIGILPVFSGRAIHDGWGCYRHYGCKHGACNAHHLRELTFLAEEEGQIWAQRMKLLLIEIKECVDDSKKQGLSALAAEKITDFENRYDLLIQNGYLANPKAKRSGKRGKDRQTKGRNLIIRLEYRDDVLAFMYDFSVPFDNNLAKRDIRMMKVRQKVSGCFRTNEGAETFGKIRGYLSTMRKQGHNMLDILESVMKGQPRAPAF